MSSTSGNDRRRLTSCAADRAHHRAAGHTRCLVDGLCRDLRGSAGAAIPGRCAAGAGLSEPSRARICVLAFGAHDPILSRIVCATLGDHSQSGDRPRVAGDAEVPADLPGGALWCLAATLLMPLLGVSAYHRCGVPCPLLLVTGHWADRLQRAVPARLGELPAQLSAWRCWRRRRGCVGARRIPCE